MLFRSGFPVTILRAVLEKKGYIEYDSKNFTKINDKICHHKNNFDDDKGKFEFAIQWHNEISEFKISFCNLISFLNI